MREDIRDRFPGVDGGAANCPVNTGDGELERGPEGEVMGFKPAVLKGSTAAGALFSVLK